MDQETIDLIAKYRQYNPEYEKYTDEEITQLGLKGFNQSDNTQDGDKFNFIDYLPFGSKSISGSIMRGIGQYMPERDPRQTALNKFYDVNNGTIQSGLMAGYNPVSGGFLNKITGGRFGDPTNYGLQDAYQKRIDTINKTIRRKSAANENYDDTELTNRRNQLSLNKINESMMLDNVNENTAYKNELGDSYSGGETTTNVGGQNITSYNDPFDPGGGEKDGGFIDGSNRRPFNSGGRARYFFGGRARLQGGGGADMGAPEKAAERASKGYGAAPDTGSKSGTNDYSSFQQNVNHQKAMRDYQREKPSTLDNAMNLGSELSYLNNIKNLNVLGIVGNIGVNKFRDYLDSKKTTEEEDKLSYNTNPLPTDNYTTKLVGPALAQMRSLEKAKGMEQFGGPFSIEQGNALDKLKQMDQEETIYSKPIKFTAANGGRAMFKNGGLASIL